jgi:hypothetical protein
MAWAFGGHHHHVDILGGHDCLEMDIKSVRGAKRLSGLEVRGDALGIDAGLHFVGKGGDDQICGFDGVFDTDGIESVLDRQLAVGRVLAVGDDHLYAAVAEIEAVGMALGSEAENGDGFAFKGVERGVLLVNHLQGRWHGNPLKIGGEIVMGKCFKGNRGDAEARRQTRRR